MKIQIKILFLLVVIAMSGCCRKSHPSGETSQWEYRIVTRGDLYRPVMIQLEDSGKAKFFTDKARTSWIIDFSNQWALMEAAGENYLQKRLNEYGAEGWELVSLEGQQSATNYIFKRKK